jgi:RhtB (resistance to homoserine/threonine) family protein
MQAAIILSGILGVLLIGAMSPGPSFVLVARTSIALSRRDGLAAALGMGLGSVVFATLVLFGLQALLTRIAWLDTGLRLVGGAYLIYLAVRLWRSARDTIAVPATDAARATSGRRSFAVALATQLSNPKTALFYASIFATLLPAQPPAWLLAALPPLIFLVEAGWYSVVALAFSSGRPRAAYLRAKAAIDRTAGVVLGGLGLRLIVSAASP